MTAFDQLVIRIENSIRTEENQDSSMRNLHLEIFQQLKMTPLPHETSGRQLLGVPGREEQIRIEFIQKAQKSGPAWPSATSRGKACIPADPFS